MRLEEALQILGLTLENYSEAIAHKNYINLLRKYHPDNENDISVQEKLSKSQKLNLAYEIVKSQLKDRKGNDTGNILEKDYAIESQLLDLSLQSLPKEIGYIIDQYYKKYISLYQFEKIKNETLPYESECTFYEYRQEYKQYRRELTYHLFNYLQNRAQKKEEGRSPLYKEIYWEYCEKYGSYLPFILPSLYEIVTKFVAFYPIFIKQMIEIKEYLKREMEKAIDKKIEECQKKEYYPYMQKEIDVIKRDTLKRIECFFAIEPNEKVDSLEMRFILLSFKELVDSIVERYEYFINNRNFLIENIENSIYEEIGDFNIKMNLVLELLPLYEETNIENFFCQIHRIKEVLPSHLKIAPLGNTSSFYLTKDKKK